MKRICGFPFFVAVAFFATGIAVAKSASISLPARNPERPVPVADAAAKNTDTATPVPMADAKPPAAGSSDTLATSETDKAAPAPKNSEPIKTSEPIQTGERTTTVAAVPKPHSSIGASSEGTKPAEPQAAPDPGDGTTAATPKPAEPAPDKEASEDKAEEIAVGPSVAPENAPLPDINPNRDPMSPKAPEPALDYASILKPLLEYRFKPNDESRMRFVMRNSGTIAETADKISDPAVRDFALWYRYKHNKSSNLDADTVEKYRLSHPHWPSLSTLRVKAETSLFLKDEPVEKIRAFFSESEPESAAGKAALAGVHLKDGKEDDAKALILAAWRHNKLHADVEKKILSKYGNMLTEADHRARVDVLLYPDRASAASAALRAAKKLPESERKKVNARIAVIKRAGNAGKLLDGLPDDAVKQDIGLRFNNIQWLRRTKNKEKRLTAFDLLLEAPLDPKILINMREWWIERRINVRAALNDGHPRTAYKIAAKHGLESGDSYTDAEFLAGWIALRYLNEPQNALRHFLLLRRAATHSRTIARAEYWLGRTALRLGDRGSAAIHFHGAAKFPQYFYGQLGRQALDPRPARLAVTPTPVPTPEDIDSFLAHHGVRAIGIARAAKLEWVTTQFFYALSRTLESPAEVVLLAELAKAMGKKQTGLRLSKIAFNRDLPLGDYALPVGVMPTFKSLVDERVDPALVHALSRQESEFNAAAKSPVGASGLMQLMPATARGVARRYKVHYSKARLTNPAYNTQLGEAFLSDMINSYNGSYFMALAAYNAGPGRVKEWVGIYGDPRTPDVDPIDWIERIPFTETRRYVIKIMETLQLYRSRLSGPTDALHLVQDLNRGRKVPPHATASVASVPILQTP